MKNSPHIQDELKDIAPLLSEIDKSQEGFNVPHLYFETFQDKVMNRLAEQPEPESRFSRFFKTLLQPRYAMALGSVLILLLATTMFLRPVEEQNTDILASISTEELSSYLNENIDDFDLDLLMEDNATSTLDFSDGMDFDLNELEEYIDNDFIDQLEDQTLEDFL